jgi:galactokinase/mevalonate kinase-like predicted kinase
MFNKIVFFLEFPAIILNIEKVELGISAGLQDRVIQVYKGLVFMDFTKKDTADHSQNKYTPMSINLLPKMYLLYDLFAGNIVFFCFVGYIFILLLFFT